MLATRSPSSWQRAVALSYAVAVFSGTTRAAPDQSPQQQPPTLVTAGYAGVSSTPPQRVFLKGDDSMALWRQTVGRAVGEAPITRLRSPDFDPTHPAEGIIETSWVPFSGGTGTRPMQKRGIAHFLPDTGGAWLETVTETSYETVSSAPLGLPSVTDASPLLRPVAQRVQPVAMWTPDPNLPRPSGLEVAQLPPVSPPVMPGPAFGTEPIPTMPPAYPDSWAPFALPSHPTMSRALRKVGSDYRNFYSCESLVCITAAFGAGALMANTGFDTTMQNAWQTGVTPTGLGTFFSGCKPMGEGRYALPIFGAAAATGWVLEGNAAGNIVGEWGSRSLRMFAVGAPPLYVLQLATGASRPSDEVGSQWHFWNDNNGVSGHAFIGAIPFLAAAEMVESPLLKGTLYVCSTFTGFSRMTDNAHYPSQVFLGWYLAWASSMAVSKTEIMFDRMTVRVVPLPTADLGGLAVEARW
jgi:membrane-associated phospholipid phosphatase